MAYLVGPNDEPIAVLHRDSATHSSRRLKELRPLAAKNRA